MEQFEQQNFENDMWSGWMSLDAQYLEVENVNSTDSIRIIQKISQQGCILVP